MSTSPEIFKSIAAEYRDLVVSAPNADFGKIETEMLQFPIRFALLSEAASICGYELCAIPGKTIEAPEIPTGEATELTAEDSLAIIADELTEIRQVGVTIARLMTMIPHKRDSVTVNDDGTMIEGDAS